MIFGRKKKLFYRVDTIIYRDQMDLEESINNITQTVLWSSYGRWRLHTLHIERIDADTHSATIVCEREA